MSKKNPHPSPESLKNKFVTSVDISICTTLDGKLSLPVGSTYVSKSGDSTAAADTIKSVCGTIQTCLGCLWHKADPKSAVIKGSDICQVTKCTRCEELGTVCRKCLDGGHTSVHTSLRRCDNSVA